MSIWSDAAAAVYNDPNFGVAATWTPAGGSPLAITVVLDRTPAEADVGMAFEPAPRKTPGRLVRIQAFQLAALGLMTTDAATRAPVPAWAGATINFDGVERKIVVKPAPCDDLTRDEWIFALG